MARIRSVHPGLFTDEAFMAASAHARLLIIGLGCEAWDDGVFEVKPLTLKARLFPVDPIDVAELLSELEALNFFRRFTARGRAYGAIRNFRRHQRPKKPNSSGVLPPELQGYVSGGEPPPEPDGDGAAEQGDQSSTGSEPVPNQSPKVSADGGWRMEDGGEEENHSRPVTAEPRSVATRKPGPGSGCDPPSRSELDDVEARCRSGLGSHAPPDDVVIGPVARLAASGYDLGREVIPAMLDAAMGARTRIRTWRLLAEKARERIDADRAAGRKRAAATGPPLDPAAQAAGQRSMVRRWQESPSSWSPRWGPRPDEAGCFVPAEILSEMGVMRRAA